MRSRVAAAAGDGPVSPRELFEEMLRILPNESAWSPGCLARREDGTKTVTTDLACTQRSMPGAMHCALSYYGNRWQSPFPGHIEDRLTKAAGKRYDLFDEDPQTTFADIRRVISDALAAA